MIVLFGAVLLLGGIYLVAIKDSLMPDLKSISIHPDIGGLQRHDVLNRLDSIDINNMSLRDIKASLEDAEWIRFVSVKRLWPSELRVGITPQTPIAYWNDDSFINSAGQVFRSDFVESAKLPNLYGEDEDSAEIMSTYQKLSMALSDAALRIEVLRLDKRGVWSFQDQFGVKVILGKHDISERLRRFLRVYLEMDLKDRNNLIERIDTRYSNGVAISWKENGDNFEVATTY